MTFSHDNPDIILRAPWHCAILENASRRARITEGSDCGCSLHHVTCLLFPRLWYGGPCIMGLPLRCSPRHRAWSQGCKSRQGWRKCAPWSALILHPSWVPQRLQARVMTFQIRLSQKNNMLKNGLFFIRHTNASCISFAAFAFIVSQRFYCVQRQTHSLDKHLIHNDIRTPLSKCHLEQLSQKLLMVGIKHSPHPLTHFNNV